MEETITQQWGAFGAVFLLVLVPLGTFALRLWLKLNEVQQARVDDAKAVATTVISVIKDFSEAAREQVRSQTEQQAVSEHVVEALRRVEGKLGELETALTRAMFEGRSPTGRTR